MASGFALVVPRLVGQDIGPKWLYWPWVSDHLSEIQARLTQHIELTVLSVGFGLLIAFPLAILCVRYRRLYGPVLGVTGVLYTIPSLALFALLLPVTGLSATTAVIPLTAYTLLIGQGGLGQLLLDGLNRDFRTPLTVGIVLSLALAVVADLLLVGILRASTPWRRKARA